MNQIELLPETRSLLDRIRHSSKVLSTYEMPSDLAEAAVWEIGRMLLDEQRVPMVSYNQFHWFPREMAKLLRTRTGWDLALELEICLRKWAAYRMDPVLLQALVRECLDRIGGMTPEEIEAGGDSTTKAPRHRTANDRHSDQAHSASSGQAPRVEESRS
jgi:hypothetical protein